MWGVWIDISNLLDGVSIPLTPINSVPENKLMNLQAMINALRDPEKEALLQHKAQLVYFKNPIDLSLFFICYFIKPPLSQLFIYNYKLDMFP